MKCRVSSCDKSAHCKKLCSGHYHKLKRYGTTKIEKRLYKSGNQSHPLYSTYNGMLNRCSNPNSESYYLYGGRGIKVCERWKGTRGFNNFLKDMGHRPDGYTIDRIDNNIGYDPNNCRWVNNTLQSVNKRKRTDNTSGTTGITWDGTHRKWTARISISGKTIFLGCFNDKGLAIKARKKAEEKYFKPLLEGAPC